MNENPAFEIFQGVVAETNRFNVNIFVDVLLDYLLYGVQMIVSDSMPQDYRSVAIYHTSHKEYEKKFREEHFYAFNATMTLTGDALCCV